MYGKPHSHETYIILYCIKLMIHVASLYYFTLLQKISPKYIFWIQNVLQNIDSYLSEENITVMKHKSELWEYQVLSCILEGIWKIYLYNKKQLQADRYYYPSFFCDIHIAKNLLQDDENIKKIIFLLSNIFECFDEFDEKNLMIEFHGDIEQTVYNKKEYTLRYDFININSLKKIYHPKRMSYDIEIFVQENSRLKTMSEIKNEYPEIYRTLLFFVYSIFSLQKNLTSTQTKLKEILSYEEKNWENIHIDISQERLKLNEENLQTTLTDLQKKFESFMNILVKK